MSISLAKGQVISLKKSDKILTNVCLGVNWGAIKKGGILGFGSKMEAVDLDASVILFDDKNRLLTTVYFGKLSAPGIKHSGDDLTGDMDGDDGIDNEVITVDLDQIDSRCTQLVFVLNSFRGHDFKDIPYASIRMFEGTSSRVDNVIATYDIANDSSFAGSVSMVMAKLFKEDGVWKFKVFGEAIPERRLEGTIEAVRSRYL